MKQQIWKFPITPENTTIEMPKGSEILTIQTQKETPCIWALVDPNAEKVTRIFEMYGTGHEIDKKERMYINSFQLYGGGLVFHLFELLTPSTHV